MSAKVFPDTNIWLYSLIESDPWKHAQAAALLADEATGTQ